LTTRLLQAAAWPRWLLTGHVSALVMGALALGRIPYGAWVRFVMPLLLKLFGLAIVFLVMSVHLGGTFGLAS
jgi:hypothetical protein